MVCKRMLKMSMRERESEAISLLRTADHDWSALVDKRKEMSYSRLRSKGKKRRVATFADD